MTEEQAKKKWCPFARVGASGFNRIHDEYRDGPILSVDARCVASACMMWRAGDCSLKGASPAKEPAP